MTQSSVNVCQFPISKKVVHKDEDDELDKDEDAEESGDEGEDEDEQGGEE